MRLEGQFGGGCVRGLALALAGVLCGVAQGQGMAAMGHSMGGMKPIPAPEQLPIPVKMTGIGNSHIAITATPEAQMWFDQGLTLLHDFWDYESAKAFEQGIRVDPQCAMCYWGLYQAEGMRGDDADVYKAQALAAAERLERRVSKPEKLYLEAAEAESKAKPGDKAGVTAIYRELVKKEPKDPEARIFLAESMGDGYTEAGEPKGSTKEKIAILEGVLKDYPEDSAANHYWIHAMEPSDHPERAIESAARLASLAPNSGHMVHMPGHIYYRTGDYADAERWFAASTEVDERYMREQHVAPDDDWNYVHNLMYGIANLMEEGKLEEASALSDRLAGARGELSTTLYIWSPRDQMTRVDRRLPIALRVGDWATVAKFTGPESVLNRPNTANLRFLAAEMHAFATGMQALDSKDLGGAEAASARMDAGLWRETQDHEAKTAAMKPKQDAKAAAQDSKPSAQGSKPSAQGSKPSAQGSKPSAQDSKPSAEGSKPPAMPIMPDAEFEAVTEAMTVASLELRAGVLVEQGKLDGAKELYAQATKKDKDLGYREPPVYVRPVGETEGAALIAAKDYPGAIAAYKEALVERPNSGFGLYGLARAEELAGEHDAAQRDYQAFLRAWKSADPDLPQVAHARAALVTVAAERGPA